MLGKIADLTGLRIHQGFHPCDASVDGVSWWIRGLPRGATARSWWRRRTGPSAGSCASGTGTTTRHPETEGKQQNICFTILCMVRLHVKQIWTNSLAGSRKKLDYVNLLILRCVFSVLRGLVASTAIRRAQHHIGRSENRKSMVPRELRRPRPGALVVFKLHILI